ncbi:MAG: hypothetical protein D6818_03755, partial [Bacteroidetes bacterium]
QWKSQTRSHSLSASLYYLSFRDLNPLFYLPLPQQDNYTASLGYRLGILPARLDIGLSANYSLLRNGTDESTSTGLTLDLGKRLADDKLSLNGSFTLNHNSFNGQSDGLYYQLNANASWALSEQHSITFYAVWLRRQPRLSGNEVHELRTGISYGFNF